MSWWILGFFGWVSGDPHQRSIEVVEPFFCTFFGDHFGSIFGPGREPKIDPKRDLWRKMRSPEPVFYRFFSFSCFFRLFHGILSQKCSKNQWNFERVFSSCARFFFQTSKSQILCTGAVFWAVFTFSFFFQKIAKIFEKNRWKRWSQKNDQKWPPGGSQNS